MPLYNPPPAAGGVPTTRAIATTAPITGGGDFSIDRTHAMANSNSSTDGYLKKEDFVVFNTKAGLAANTFTGTQTVPFVAIAGSSGGFSLEDRSDSSKTFQHYFLNGNYFIWNPVMGNVFGFNYATGTMGVGNNPQTQKFYCQAAAGGDCAKYADSTGTTMFGVDNGPNVTLFAAGSYGGGVKVMFIGNRTTAPSSNPTGGGILYADSGALKYRGSSGTVTTLGAA